MISEIKQTVRERTSASREAILKNRRKRRRSGNDVYAVSGRGQGVTGIGTHDTRTLRLYAAIRDHVYTALRPAAMKIASQPIHIGYATPKMRQGQTFKKAYEDYGVIDGMEEKINGEYFVKDHHPEFMDKTFEYSAKTHDPGSQKIPKWLKKEMGHGVDIAEGHPLSYILEDPNPFMTQWSMLYCTVMSIMATGKSFWFPERNKKKASGYDIWYLPSHWVSRVPSEGSAINEWLVRPSNSAESWTLKLEELIYFPFPDPANPIDTYAPVQSQARAINTDDKVQTAQQETMKNGVFPGVILKAGTLPVPEGVSIPQARPHLTPEQRKELVTSIKTYAGGAYNFGEPFVVDGMIEDIVPFTHKPRDMDFEKLSKVVEERIFMGIGTNPYVAGKMENANRATAVVSEETHNSIQVNPIITLLSQVLTRHFGPKLSGKRKKLRVWIEEAKAFDADQLHRRVQVSGTQVMNKGQMRRYIMNGEVDFSDEELNDQDPIDDMGMDPMAGFENPFALEGEDTEAFGAGNNGAPETEDVEPEFDFKSFRKRFTKSWRGYPY